MKLIRPDDIALARPEAATKDKKTVGVFYVK